MRLRPPENIRTKWNARITQLNQISVNRLSHVCCTHVCAKQKWWWLNTFYRAHSFSILAKFEICIRTASDRKRTSKNENSNYCINRWSVLIACCAFESAIVATNPPLHVMRPAGICQFWRCDENVLFHFCSPPNGIGMNATAPAATASYLCAHHSRNIERQVKHSMIADRDMRRWQATSVSKRARLFVPPTLTRYGLVARRYVNCNSTLRQRTISQHV